MRWRLDGCVLRAEVIEAIGLEGAEKLFAHLVIIIKYDSECVQDLENAALSTIPEIGKINFVGLMIHCLDVLQPDFLALDEETVGLKHNLDFICSI